MHTTWVILLLFIAGCQSRSADAPAPAEPDEFAQARRAMLAELRDPESARFGPFARGHRGAVCGSINARNGHGGFTGAQAFAWSPATGVLFYDYPGELGHWRERGEFARRFAALGCSIGPDQTKAIAAVEALEASDRKLGLRH